MPHDESPARKKADRAPKPPTPGQRLLTGHQIEQVYGWPYRTVYDLHLRGRLSAVRINRTLWFERSDVEQLISRSKEVHA
jgi:hypothetical protein